MNRKTTARIAAVLLTIHGLTEVTGLFAIKLMSNSLVSFGGMDKVQIEANIGSIIGLGMEKS